MWIIRNRSKHWKKKKKINITHEEINFWVMINQNKFLSGLYWGIATHAQNYLHHLHSIAISHNQYLGVRNMLTITTEAWLQLRSWPKPSSYETVFSRMVKNPSHLSRRSTIPLLGGCKVDRIPRNLSSKTAGSWKEQTVSVTKFIQPQIASKEE